MAIDTLTNFPSEVYVLLSAILGGAISLFGTFVFNWNQRRIEKQRLRTALATEIKSINEDRIIRFASDDYSGVPPVVDEATIDENLDYETVWKGIIFGRFSRIPDSHLDMQVYQNNINNIGPLSEDEIEAIIRYYEQTEVVREGIERVKDATRLNSPSNADILKYQDELDNLHKEAILLKNWKIIVLDVLGELEDSDYSIEDIEIREGQDDIGIEQHHLTN